MLPSKLRTIYKKAFMNDNMLETIEYDGTEAQFRAIIINHTYLGVTSNPEIKFNDGTSKRLNDL